MNGHATVRAAPGGDDKRQLSYDIRIWKTRLVKGAKGRSYQVRWTVAGRVRYATFSTKALADSHEAKLKTASREGEAFDIAAGLPLSMVDEDRNRELSWYEFACAYVDMKWPESLSRTRGDRSPTRSRRPPQHCWPPNAALPGPPN